MRPRLLRRLFPEHSLRLAIAPPGLPGAPEELFAATDHACWFGVADHGRLEELLRAYRIPISRAAMDGLPIVLALQSHEDALAAETWLLELRPDWEMRYSVELLDAFEALGMIPRLATLAA
ncbi:hypothetical protein [Benzoatithermus flavus]|uniref:Uncharacterized protein n=1 Tax=Benzoatithermus flavus TaxID=3108223 RepID=A0ABU8XLT6_9PROT